MSTLLSNYWQGLVGFILGVASLVLGETFVEWFRKWRNRPKIHAIPLLGPYKNGLNVNLTLTNIGKTVLLETVNRLFVNTPQLIVEGKLTRIFDHNQVIRRVPWLTVEGEGGSVDEPRDIFPPPDTEFLNLAVFTSFGGESVVSFSVDRDSFSFDLLGRKEDLVFSDSVTEARPTRTLRVLFILVIKGKTVYDEAIQKRFAYLLEIPNFGGSGPCDFAKATMREVPVKHEWESLGPFMQSHGISDLDTTDSTPPFPAPRSG